MDIRKAIFALFLVTSAIAMNPAPAFAGDEDEEDGPIGWFTFAPKGGYQFAMGGSAAGVDGVDRNSFKLLLNLDFGGDGYAFELAPYFTIGDTATQPFGDLMSAGLYLGLFTWRIHAGNWYPHFGLGTTLGVIFGSGNIGLETGLRVPIGFTWYAIRDLGIVVEVGPGYMLSGWGSTFGDIGFGSGFAMDAMVGLRVP